MMSKTIMECPLDRKCFDEKENKRCQWYINYPIVEQDGTSKEDWRCAQIWTSVLLLEVLNMLAYTFKAEKPVSH